jgi:hypothetical protein
MRLALGAVAALALAAAACGRVESEPNLAKAVERTQETGSFAFAMTTRFEGAGDEFEWSCGGAVDSKQTASRLVCPGTEGGAETITVDGTTYHRYPSTDGKWWKLGAGEDMALPEEYSPDKILGLLRAASRKTERVGEEDVRGEPTVRYALTVDCEQAERYDCAGETALVDVWIDVDGLVRRGAFEQGSATTTIEFFDFGKPVEVDAPSTEQVEPWPVLPTPCTPGKADPIRVGQASEALWRAGFDVRPDESLCGDGVAGGLSNLPADLDPTDLLSRDGYLSCVVHTGENGIWFILRQDVGPGAHAPVERELENLDCSLYVEGPQVSERIAALDSALDELRHELGP